MKSLIIFLFLFLFYSHSFSNQTISHFGSRSSTDSVNNNPLKYNSLQLFYQNGYVFPTNSFVKGSNATSDTIDAFQTFSIQFLKQTVGNKLWEQLYKYPYWGGGIYIADFHDPKEIGFPISFYGFIIAPFKRWTKFTFNYELAFGTAFNWKHFNRRNKYNIAIGSPVTFYIDAGLNLEYLLSKYFNLGLGFSLTHFSNGALKMPNMGINTIAPKISLKYNLYPHRPEFIRQEVPVFKKQTEWLFSFYGGIQNILTDANNISVREKYEGVNFPVFGISALLNRQISYKSKIGFGANITYDGSINAKMAVEKGELVEQNAHLYEKIELSIYPSYELVVSKFSLLLQPGIYIYRKKLSIQPPVFYQRIGVNYKINNHLFTGIYLRAYKFYVSNYIEWTIGYRLPWKER
jgi:hypothetical protein